MTIMTLQSKRGFCFLLVGHGPTRRAMRMQVHLFSLPHIGAPEYAGIWILNLVFSTQIHIFWVG